LRLGELKDNLAFSHHPELVASDLLHRRGIIAQTSYFDMQPADVSPELLILEVYVGELLLQCPKARETLRCEDEHRDGDERQRQDSDRERSPEQVRGEGQSGGMVSRLRVAAQFSEPVYDVLAGHGDPS